MGALGFRVGRPPVAQGGLLGRGEAAQFDVLAAALQVGLERASREGRDWVQTVGADGGRVQTGAERVERGALGWPGKGGSPSAS